MTCSRRLSTTSPRHHQTDPTGRHAGPGREPDLSSAPRDEPGGQRRTPRSRPRGSNVALLAERAGFEPATHLSARTRFPVALLRPLGHLSVGRVKSTAASGGSYAYSSNDSSWH